MASVKKKVLLFLVEGISDEISFEGLWESFFENNEVRVYVLRCDITTQDFSSPSTILSKLKQPIDRFLNSTKLKKNDIQKIVHLIDTDGAFIPESCIEKKSGDEQICYMDEKIITSNPDGIRQRNARKTAVVKRLFSTPQIYNGIPYEIYYLSRNLEHVLHNKAESLSDAEKKDLSNKFDEMYAGRLSDFLAFISSSEFAVKMDYKDSWNFIMESTNSLHRHSNIHLLFSNQ
ncbi:MAG: hypothetical protein J6W54_10580 [Fibrobacter sp.]|uniref:hypothetical protein n=1 Tax=Fibrobacter sp. TaxID=35828 RepID=UPI001B122F19|nr:hypothetical protein [Fibrobacter sp.]MBO7061519.1 hypothetical protein [Fibrobacter sp.]